MNIFTYGSLMYPEVWSIIVQGKYEKCNGYINGYLRRKMHHEIYPGLKHENGKSIVEGMVYFGVDLNDLRRIDDFEGEYYERIRDLAHTKKHGTTECNIYIIKDKYVDLLSDEEWSPEWFSSYGISEFLKEYRGFS